MTRTLRHGKTNTSTLYEKYVNKEINADEYKVAKAGIDANLERARIVKAIFAKENAKKESFDGFKQIATKAVKAKELTCEITDALINRVCVYPRGRVEISWKTQDADSVIMNEEGNDDNEVYAVSRKQ